jgi:hypothetical protein
MEHIFRSRVIFNRMLYSIKRNAIIEALNPDLDQLA